MNPLLMKGIQVLPGNHIIIDMTFFSIKINPEICLHIQNYSGKEELWVAVWLFSVQVHQNK